MTELEKRTIPAADRPAAGNRARARALAAAAAATTVAVLVVPWLLGPKGLSGLDLSTADPGASPSEPAWSASSSGPSAPPSADPTPAAPLPSLPGMSPPEATADLSLALKAAAARLMPRAAFAPTVVAFEGGERLLQPFDVVANGSGYYVGWAGIRNGTLAGQFTIAIWPAADDRKSPNPGCDMPYFPPLGCESRTGARGEQITIEKGHWENSTTVEYRVKVHRPDGVILMAAVTNEVGHGYGYPAPTQGAIPPITTEILVDLLLTQGLELVTGS